MKDMQQSGLYQRLTRTAPIRDIVSLFYDKVLADARVNYIFEGMDMERLRDHQSEFLMYALGGHAGYHGRSLREAHRPLVEKYGLNETHFAAVAENLESALRDTGFPPDEITEVMAVVASVRDDVLDL